MIELIFLSPLLVVIVAALAVRFGVLQRPFPLSGWAILVICAFGRPKNVQW